MRSPNIRRSPSGVSIPLNGSTRNYSQATVLLDYQDANNYIRQSWPSACSVVVQSDAIVDFPVDTLIIVCQAGAGAITIIAGSGVALNIPPSLSLTLIEQFCQVSLRKVAANTWDVIGGLA